MWFIFVVCSQAGSWFIKHDDICLLSSVCSVPSEPVTIKENNTIDAVVVHINTTTKNVTLTLTENPDNAFDLRGLDLIVKKRLDFEVWFLQYVLPKCCHCPLLFLTSNLATRNMMTVEFCTSDIYTHFFNKVTGRSISQNCSTLPFLSKHNFLF